MMKHWQVSLLAIVTMTGLLLATAGQAQVIGSDLTPAERAAAAKMFESLGELVALDEEVSEEQQRELVARFLKSLGSVSRAATEGDEAAAVGVEIEKLFNAISTLVELGEESADSPEMRHATASLMRTIGSLVEADPESELSEEQAELVTGLFDAIGDLIEHEDDPEAEKRFASRLFLSLAALIAEEGGS
jgi:hypothetical protein